MRDFESFVLAGDVRRSSPDLGLARSLIEFSADRMNFAKSHPLEEKGATFVFEEVYESMLELIHALLAIKGYKSYSHVASIAFLKRVEEFSDSEISLLDNAREKRNGAKYYGRIVTKLETEELMRFEVSFRVKMIAVLDLSLNRK